MSPDSLYSQHGLALWLALVAVAALLAIWLGVVQMQTRRTAGRLEEIFHGAESENIARMLADYLSSVRATAADVARMKREHDQMAAIMPSTIRHVGLVRFSPFHDTGGDQSFAMALLDGKMDGIVVTALHSRTDSRLYAKPIQRGTSQYALTPEEIEAMERAVGRPAGATRASSA